MLTYPLNGMFLCLGYGCASVSDPFNVENNITVTVYVGWLKVDIVYFIVCATGVAKCSE